MRHCKRPRNRQWRPSSRAGACGGTSCHRSMPQPTPRSPTTLHPGCPGARCSSPPSHSPPLPHSCPTAGTRGASSPQPQPLPPSTSSPKTPRSSQQGCAPRIRPQALDLLPWPSSGGLFPDHRKARPRCTEFSDPATKILDDLAW